MSYIGNQPYQAAFVTDTFSGNGSTTAFTMSVAPAGTTSVLVAVTGVLQDPSTYSVSGTTLTFSAAPPSGTGNISVRYLGIPASGVTTTAYRTVTEFTATAGQTTFTPPSYTVGYINVYRNGVRLGSADYTATNGTTVVLAKAATAGDLVVVESFYVSSVLNAIPATAGSVGTTYLAAGSVTQSILGTNVAGTGPAFAATPSANQSISSATATKINFDTAYTWGTASNSWDATNKRFRPSVAGYYLITGELYSTTSWGDQSLAWIYINGAADLRAQDTGSKNYNLGFSALVYLNGSTDYLEIYVYSSAAQTIYASSSLTWIRGVLVRAA